jgi:hypothetical protein
MKETCVSAGRLAQEVDPTYHGLMKVIDKRSVLRFASEYKQTNKCKGKVPPSNPGIEIQNRGRENPVKNENVPNDTRIFKSRIEVGIRTNQLPIPTLQVVGTNSEDV